MDAPPVRLDGGRRERYASAEPFPRDIKAPGSLAPGCQVPGGEQP